MAKKTLEEKIKDIVFYATVFFILYLIIGFLIKSEWLSNFKDNWTYSYELLMDAFTLTAYFVAPVAAFVLFSDWRMQHKEVSNEKNSHEVRQALWRAYLLIKDIVDTDTNGKVGARVKKFYENLFFAKQLFENIYVFNNESLQFKNDVIDIFKSLEESHQKWSKCVHYALALDIQQECNPEQVKEREVLRQDYYEAHKQTLRKLNNLKELKV